MELFTIIWAVVTSGLFMFLFITKRVKATTKNTIFMTAIPLLALLSCFFIQRPPVNEYQYQAVVNCGLNSKGSMKTVKIDFNSFTQDGNHVIINNYVEEICFPMLSFKGYGEEKEKLIITLTDNAGYFKYTDRQSKEVFNDKMSASQ